MHGSGTPGESGVLAGVRVLELGSYVAAPTAGRLLASFGADVIKIERPRVGDEARQWHVHGGETSLLWRSLARNKRSVTIDLRQAEGVDLALRLVRESDVVLEGFRPGTLERLGLGPQALAKVAPDVILVRVSGFGQSGPYRQRAGFGSVAEAMGGLRHLTGYPDRPPTRVGVSLGDSVAGLHAAIGVLLSLLGRQQSPPREPGLPAETVDVALYESVYSLLDSVVAEYEGFGVIRQRGGTTIEGVAPSGTYRCADSRYVVIGANADAVFARFARAMGREDLARDPALADGRGRAARADELDAVITPWIAARPLSDVLTVMEAAGVPAAAIFDAADISVNDHYAARGAHERYHVDVGAGETRLVGFPAPVPKLVNQPAVSRWAGPELGAHTREVLGGLLGLSDAELASLTAREVI